MNPKDYIELKSAFSGTIDVSEDWQYDTCYPRSLQTYLDGQTLALSWNTADEALHQIKYQADAVVLRTFPKLFDDGCWHPILCGLITFNSPEWPENLLAIPSPQPRLQWHISIGYSISNIKKLSHLIHHLGAEVCFPYTSRMRLPEILPIQADDDTTPKSLPGYPDEGIEDDIPF